jgi:hypothetical protein
MTEEEAEHGTINLLLTRTIPHRNTLDPVQERSTGAGIKISEAHTQAGTLYGPQCMLRYKADEYSTKLGDYWLTKYRTSPD